MPRYEVICYIEDISQVRQKLIALSLIVLQLNSVYHTCLRLTRAVGKEYHVLRWSVIGFWLSKRDLSSPYRKINFCETPLPIGQKLV